MATWFNEDPACCVFGCILPVLAAVGTITIMVIVAKGNLVVGEINR